MWAFLSFVPAYPMLKGFVLRWFTIIFMTVKWLMSFFSSSHQRKSLAGGGWWVVGGGMFGWMNSWDILHIHFSPISSTMKSSVFCFNFADSFSIFWGGVLGIKIGCFWDFVSF